MGWSRVHKYKAARIHGPRRFLSFASTVSPPDASCDMLFAPALALLAVVFNFCAILHITNKRNAHSTSRWQLLDDAMYGLGETTVVANANHLDIVAPPPPTPSPIYSPALRRAEWVYRSSAVRILDLVEGSSKVQASPSGVSPPPLPRSSPSPTKPTDPVASTDHLPPTLTTPSHPATFEPFPTYDPSTESAIVPPVARSWGLMVFFSCFVYAAIFTWLKVSISRSSRSSLSLSMS